MVETTGRMGHLNSGTIEPADAAPWLAARTELLTNAWPSVPPWFETEPTPGPVAPRVERQLRDHGVAGLRLGDPLDLEAFVSLGAALGACIPETDPSVLPFVTNEVVLNLRGEATGTSVALAPFTTRELTLHSEGSRRPADRQPTHIVLMCLDPGTEAAAQTVLVPAAAVLALLPPDTVATLRVTRENVAPGSPPLLRDQAGTPVFSFRDLGDEPFHWQGRADAAAVARAVTSLLTACYTAGAFATHWRRGDLVVIDNRRWFHGRTRGRPTTGDRTVRHLQRLRIGAGTEERP